MSDRAISRFPVPNLADLPEDVKDRILKVQEKSGFVPNVFLALAHRPDEFRAFFAYHDALMEKEGGLSKGEREMIVVATSGLNQCLYCVVAHGALDQRRRRRRAAPTRFLSRGRVGYRSDRGVLCLVESNGELDEHAAERRVLSAGARPAEVIR